MQKKDKFYIDGLWISPRGKEVIEVINPATETVIGIIPEGTAEDVDAAVNAARIAFEDWSGTSTADRAVLLDKIAAGLKERTEEIAATITAEMGMPLKLSRAIQAGLPTANMALFAKQLRQYPFEEREGNSLVVKEAVGVVGRLGHVLALRVSAYRGREHPHHAQDTHRQDAEGYHYLQQGETPVVVSFEYGKFHHDLTHVLPVHFST